MSTQPKSPASVDDDIEELVYGGRHYIAAADDETTDMVQHDLDAAERSGALGGDTSMDNDDEIADPDWAQDWTGPVAQDREDRQKSLPYP